jgi:hypothetical protein
VIGGKVDLGAEEVMRGISEADRSGRIHWVGLIPDADLSAFYAGVSMSRRQLGRTSCPEIVGTGGLLVIPRT